MTNNNMQQSLNQSIKKLTLPQQLKLLNFIESIQMDISKKKSNDFIRFAGTFDDQDLKEMKEAIKDCEQINEDEW